MPSDTFDNRLQCISEQLSIMGSAGSRWISIEFFPPKTSEGIANLFKTLKVLAKYNPLFVDITWGAGGSTSELTLELATRILSEGFVVNMHLTCTNMDASKITSALDYCKANGIRNILALRGDPPVNQENWVVTENGFACAKDLVGYIHSHYEKHFCVSVAGYPEGHPSAIEEFNSTESMSISEIARHSFEFDESSNTMKYFTCLDNMFEKEILYLKQKVEEGASMVITQMFFDPNIYHCFVESCRMAGINVPIIPGIMVITTYLGFKRMIKFCKSRVPLEMMKRLDACKEDEVMFKSLGVELGIELCNRVLEFGAPGLHFYTLNSSESTSNIIDRLQL